jgi:hypothetical protein
MLGLLIASVSLATSTLVVAIVTGVLVGVTGVLAWYGRKDVAAQERPVLLVDERRILLEQQNMGERGERNLLRCHVENAGSGPALNIEAALDLPRGLQVIGAPPLQSLSTGEGPREFEWRSMPPPPPVPPHWRIALVYRDLSGRRFRTFVELTVGATYGVSPPVTQDVARIRRWRGSG